MKLKLKNEVILLLEEALRNFIQKNKDLSVKVVYGFSKNISHLKPLVKAITDCREALIKKYGEKGKNGLEALSGDSPKFCEFNDEYKAVLDTEEEVDLHDVQNAELEKSEKITAVKNMELLYEYIIK